MTAPPTRPLKKCHPGPRIESGAGFDPGSTLDVGCVLCTQSVDSRLRGNDKKGPFLWAARLSTDCYGFLRTSGTSVGPPVPRTECTRAGLPELLSSSARVSISMKRFLSS